MADAMIGRSLARMTWLTLPVLIATCALPGAAQAQGLCVACAEPDATYRCQPAEGQPRLTDARLSLLCITELAHSGHHASCTVRRQQAGTCDGPVRTVATGAAPAGQRQQPDSAATGTTPHTQPNAAPETVEDIASRAASSSKDQLEKAGSAVSAAAKKTGNAVGDAAKKSWRCLSSLFTQC